METESIRLRKIADTDHEIFPLLKQRYSPRVFHNSLVETDHIHKLFEAARWASSENNCQPWRFIYAAKGSKANRKMLDCLHENDRAWADSAPILMLSIYKERTDAGDENFRALHDLGLCLGNMAIQAQYLGVGMHQAALVDRKEAGKAFDIPEGFQAVSAIALGYYGGNSDSLSETYRQEEEQERIRIPQSDFAFENAWRDD